MKKKQFFQPTRTHRQYISIQTTISLVLLFVVIYFYGSLSSLQTSFISVFILISLINTGAILEQRSWIFYLEYARFSVCLLWVCCYYPNLLMGISAVTFLVILLYYFRPMEKRYKKLLYQEVV